VALRREEVIEAAIHCPLGKERPFAAAAYAVQGSRDGELREPASAAAA
jgi:hypothetical protein